MKLSEECRRAEYVRVTMLELFSICFRFCADLMTETAASVLSCGLPDDHPEFSMFSSSSSHIIDEAETSIPSSRIDPADAVARLNDAILRVKQTEREGPSSQQQRARRINLQLLEAYICLADAERRKGNYGLLFLLLFFIFRYFSPS